MAQLIGYLSEGEQLKGSLTIPKQLGGSTLGTKTITENDTYYAEDDGLDGYSEVTVNVSGGGGSGSIEDVTDMPVFTVEFDADLTEIQSISCSMTYLECAAYVTGQATGIDEGYAAVAILYDNIEDATSYYGCYYHGASAAALYFVVMDNTEPIGDLILDNSGTITFNSTSTALGIAGTPTATKGTVSNHSVAVTPSVTNAVGYIAGGTKTGTAVTVSASELDSGTKSITANGNNQDVVGYAAVNVNVPNSYSAADEGKVVDNGALVAQTAHADVTPTASDQTIDTTTNNSIKVKGDADLVAANIKKDVEIFGVTGSYEGSGGGMSWDDIASKAVPNGEIVLSVTEIKEYAMADFQPPQNWSVYAPNVTTIQQSCLRGCKKLTSIRLPVLTSTHSTGYFFYNCTDLALLDFGSGALRGSMLNSSALDTLILRKTSGIQSLVNVQAFNGTKFANGGTGGTIYIPKVLYDHLGDGTSLDYKAASNWSTLDGYGAVTWAKLEGSIYESPTWGH